MPVLPMRAGFTRETQRLLGQLPGRPGLWVVREGVHAAEAPTARVTSASLGTSKPLPYPSAGRAARLAHYFLLAPLLRGETVLFLDAANCFNPHRLARLCSMSYGRQARRGPEPEEFLERVYLSRAFTCFQLAELIERTPAAARCYRARLVALTGVPDIFDDEELAAAEARRVFLRSLACLRKWPAMRLTGLVFSGECVQCRPLRSWLEQQLGRAASGVYRFEESDLGLCLRPGKLPRSVLPQRSQRLCGQSLSRT